MAASGLTIEKAYPLVIAAFTTAIGIFLKFNLASAESILPNAITITAMFIGFIGTLAGILLSSNSKAILFMKKIGKLTELFRYIWLAIQWSFLFLIYCIIIQFLPGLKYQGIISYLWLFLASFSLLLIYRGISVTVSLLNSISNEDINND